MALRRELRCALVAMALLLAWGPAQALAAPQWLPAEPLESTVNGTIPADVAADAGGNAVAVWLAEGEVRAAYRPRGGPWGPPENLDPGAAIHATQPRVTVQPDGEFVAAWVVDGEGASLRWAGRPTGGDWSDPATVTGISSPPAVGALEASADGSVTVMTLDEGFGSTNTKPAGSETWGPDENVPLPQGPRLAVAPDGSAVAVASGNCGSVTSVPCLVAAFRPAGGPWGAVEPVANFASGRFNTGFEVAATPASSFTVVWGEAPSEGSSGSVLSADREPGSGGAWAPSETIVDLPDAIPGCGSFDNCFDVVTGPDGRRLAAWQETATSANALVAALRAPGDAWGSPETAGPIDTSAAVPFAVLTAAEVPVLAWGSAVGGEGVARGAHRDAGGWQPVTLADGSGGGPPPENGVYLGDLVADGEGNAVTAWEDPSGVDASGFDGIGPRFSAFSLPSGPATQPLAFSAAADDNWSGVTGIAWLFGDGAGAGDPITSHAYSAPGGYTATATATDAVGNTTEQSGPVTVGAAPTPGPTPDPCGTTDKDKDGIKDGCDTNDGSKPPVAFKTVNATVVSGDVFVKLPAGAARASQAKPPKGFVRLEGAQTIPVGSTLDTAKGRVSLRTASDTRKHVQTAQFFRGRFLIRQVRKPRGKGKKRSTKLITELRLTGSSFSKSCKAKASISAKRRSKKRVRRLFGDGKGSFRTRGRNAAATVRGTRWSVQDRCDGTLVTVQRGRVEVRDLVKRKTVVVRTGQTYLARRR